MPCNDVTELIRVEIDDADCLRGYRFIKRTCGQGVGADSLIIEALAGQSVDAILAIAPETFLERYGIQDSLEEFLTLKHLIAVQSALEVLTGRAHGGPGELCAAAEIVFDAGETVLEARISVELVAERIASCGNCKGCGKQRKPRKQVIFA